MQNMLQHERRGACVSNACERCEGARSGARVLLVFAPDLLKTSHSLALLTGSNLSSPLMPMRSLAEFRLNFSGLANWCTSFDIWERSLCIHDRRKLSMFVILSSGMYRTAQVTHGLATHQQVKQEVLTCSFTLKLYRNVSITK